MLFPCLFQKALGEQKTETTCFHVLFTQSLLKKALGEQKMETWKRHVSIFCPPKHFLKQALGEQIMET